MKKILLTGYTPQRGCFYDATAECAESYHRKGSHIGVQIIGAVLPRGALEAFRIIERIARKSTPDVIINMGTMNNTKALCLESVFKNMREDGNLIWNTRNANDYLSAKSNLLKLEELLLKNNIPTQISTENTISAHNELGYLVTKLVNESPFLKEAKNLFLHVPNVWDYESKLIKDGGEFYLNKKDYNRAIEIIIKNI